MSLAITTPLGTVIHTGDWKLDPAPEIGPMTDEARFRALGDAGVLALICDSTNAMREGESPSEQAVGVGLRGVIEKAPGRVAVTTFSSNVGRIRSIAEAARDCRPAGAGPRPFAEADDRASPANSATWKAFRPSSPRRITASSRARTLSSSAPAARANRAPRLPSWRATR